jgi:hypothetical protein
MTNTYDIYTFIFELKSHFQKTTIRQIGAFFLFSGEDQDQLITFYEEDGENWTDEESSSSSN